MYAFRKSLIELIISVSFSFSVITFIVDSAHYIVLSTDFQLFIYLFLILTHLFYVRFTNVLYLIAVRKILTDFRISFHILEKKK